MNQQIQKKPTQNLSYLVKKDKENLGIENIDQSEVIMPRLKIVQDNSSDPKGVQKGNWYNSVTGKNYGKTVSVAPIIHWKSNIKFNEGEILCRSLDGLVDQKGKSCAECGEFKFGKDGSKPTCMRTLNYIVAIKEELGEAIKNQTIISPIILSFGGISTKLGKLMNTSIILSASRKFPIYSQYFDLVAPEEERKFKVGKAFIPELKVKGYISKEEAEYLGRLFDEYSKLNFGKEISIEDAKEHSETTEEETSI